MSVIQLFKNKGTIEVRQNALHYSPDYTVHYGGRYEEGLDIALIAKRVRAEIKVLLKDKALPQGQYSVKIERYSGGQSLNVKISQLNSPWLMLNPERVQFEHQNPHELSWHLPQYTEAGQKVLKTIEGIVQAYNFDCSHSDSDYFNVNFYSNVAFDGDFIREQKALILQWAE